jgi:type I protein arginine methyltransferase
MYTISGYGSMIADRGRMEAYVKALAQAIKPDSVVLDIGTGTGIFAMIACQLGAKKVYAIEPSNAIWVGKEIATANGFSNRIQFFQKLSTQVEVPEKADVIISDLRGILPVSQNHIPSIIDARERLLKPDGVLIPQCDRLWVSVVELPDLYGRLVNPWDENGYSLNMAAARQLVTNTWLKGRATPEQILGEPKCWATLDYTTIKNTDVSAEVTWTVEQTKTAHGLSIWFDTTLAEGVSFSNAPDKPELIYSSGFFPWLQPVNLAVGDTVSVVLQANLVGDDYIWRWNTLVFNQGNPGQVKANFKQSTFFGIPLSPTQLCKKTLNYVPTLNKEGKIDKLILELMSEGEALGDIARQVVAQFPACFVNEQEALTRVGELSQRYSE